MRALLFGIALAALTGGASDGQEVGKSVVKNDTSSELATVLETEKEVFGTLNLGPIVVPEGERVGDLIDVQSLGLIARAEDCFTDLVPRKDPSSLPAMTMLSNKGVAAALGVGNTVKAGGEFKETYSFVLDFENVEVQKVSLVQLRKSLKKGVPECEAIRPFVEGNYANPISRGEKATTMNPDILGSSSSTSYRPSSTIVADIPPPLLLGMVFSARRVVRVRMSQVVDANARISFAQKLLERFGLGSNFDVDAAGITESTDVIKIQGKEVVPVAFAPAFVVKGHRKLANGQSEYEVANIDPDSLDSLIQEAREFENTSFASFTKVLDEKREEENRNENLKIGMSLGPTEEASLSELEEKEAEVVKTAAESRITILQKKEDELTKFAAGKMASQPMWGVYAKLNGENRNVIELLGSDSMNVKHHSSEPLDGRAIETWARAETSAAGAIRQIEYQIQEEKARKKMIEIRPVLTENIVPVLNTYTWEYDPIDAKGSIWLEMRLAEPTKVVTKADVYRSVMGLEN